MRKLCANETHKKENEQRSQSLKYINWTGQLSKHNILLNDLQ